MREFLANNKGALNKWAMLHPVEFFLSGMSYREIDSPDAAFSKVLPWLKDNPTSLNAMRQRMELSGGDTPFLELSCPTVYRLFDMLTQMVQEKVKFNTYETHTLIFSYKECLDQWSTHNPMAYLDLIDTFDIYLDAKEAASFIDNMLSFRGQIDDERQKKLAKKINHIASSGHYDAFSRAMEFAEPGSAMEELVVPYSIFSDSLSAESTSKIKAFLARKGDAAGDYFVKEFSRKLTRVMSSTVTIEDYMDRFGVGRDVAAKAYDKFWRVEMARGDMRDSGDRLPLGESVATKLLLDSEAAQKSFSSASQDESVKMMRKWTLLGGHRMSPSDSRDIFLGAWKASPSDPSAMAYSIALQDSLGDDSTRVFTKFKWASSSYDADKVKGVIPRPSLEAAKQNANMLYSETQSRMPALAKLARKYKGSDEDGSDADYGERRDRDSGKSDFRKVRVSSDGRKVLLYRGIQTDYEVPNIIESWSSSPLTAGGPGFDGHGVLRAWVPVEAILSHFLDDDWGNDFGPRAGDCEQEFIVIRSKIPPNSIEMLTSYAADSNHSGVVDPSAATPWMQSFPTQPVPETPK